MITDEQGSEAETEFNPNLTQVAPRIVRIRRPNRKSESTASGTQKASPVVTPEKNGHLKKSRSPTLPDPDEASMESATMPKLLTLMDLTLQIDEAVNESVRLETRMRRDLQTMNQRINEIREQNEKDTDTDTETSETMVLAEAQAEDRLRKKLEWHSQVIDALQRDGFMRKFFYFRSIHSIKLRCP